MRNHVILVDENDQATGTATKMEAHRGGLLHRAFSILIFNPKGEILLQRRAAGKYHSAGLWSNTCCSHPQPGEDTAVSARKRLSEEMGFDCPLTYAGSFQYHIDFGNDLSEHEIDHVFTGEYDGAVRPDQTEVSDYQWVRPEALREQLHAHPERFTYWLPGVLGIAGANS